MPEATSGSKSGSRKAPTNITSSLPTRYAVERLQHVRSIDNWIYCELWMLQDIDMKISDLQLAKWMIHGRELY